MNEKPVDFVLDDNTIQESYAALWRVPQSELDAALRTIGGLVETATYTSLASHLSAHAAEFNSIADVIEFIGKRMGEAQEATSAQAVKLAEIRAEYEEKLLQQIAGTYSVKLTEEDRDV